MAVKAKSSGKAAESKGPARPRAPAPRARSGKAQDPSALKPPFRPPRERARARHIKGVKPAGEEAEGGSRTGARQAEGRTDAKPEAPAAGALSRVARVLRGRAGEGRRYRPVAALVALAVAVTAIAGSGAWLLWRPDVARGVAQRPGPATGERTAELAARIEALEEAVTGLQGELAAAEERIAANVAQAAAESSAAKSAAGRNAAAIGGLSGRVVALEKSGRSEPGAGGMSEEALARAQAETQRLANAVAELGGRFAALEQSLRAARRSPPASASVARREGRLLALMELRDALRSARPFAMETAALERAFEGDEAAAAALAPLAEWAGRGVPTLETLRRRFEDLAPRLLRAAKTPADGGWLAEIWSSITSLVVIRRIGDEAPGDAPGAVLARAEAKIARGELGPAVAELAKLKGRAAEAAGAWLNAARGRLAADKALRALSARAAALLRGGQGVPTGAERPGGRPAGSTPAPRQPDATER